MRPNHVLARAERASLHAPRRNAAALSQVAGVFAAVSLTSACASRHDNEDPASTRDVPWTAERVEELHECRRAVPAWYRFAWFSLFDEANVLARKLVGAHMQCGAEGVTLGPDDVADLTPRFDFEAGAAVIEGAARMRTPVAFGIPAHAPGASLGHFTARFQGRFLPSAAGGERFEGFVRYEDLWTLEDVHPVLARIALPGKAVPVGSLPVRVTLLRRNPSTGATADTPSWEVRFPGLREPRPLDFSPRLLTLASQFPELEGAEAGSRSTTQAPRHGKSAVLLDRGTATGATVAGSPTASLGTAAARKKPLTRVRSFEILRRLEPMDLSEAPNRPAP